MKKIKQLIDGKDCYIISKSIGSILTLIGIEKQIINPKKVIILGLPLKYLEKNNMEIKQLIKNVINKTEIAVIQQKNDPIGKYVDVVKELPDSIKTFEIPGNYHVYGNLNIIKQLVDDFLK